MKRLTIELPLDQYEFLRGKALAEGHTVSGLIRNLIDVCVFLPHQHPQELQE